MSNNTFNLQIDEMMANKKLSHRERIAINILLIIFAMIYPAKYNHKMEEYMNTIKSLTNEN